MPAQDTYREAAFHDATVLHTTQRRDRRFFMGAIAASLLVASAVVALSASLVERQAPNTVAEAETQSTVSPIAARLDACKTDTFPYQSSDCIAAIMSANGSDKAVRVIKLYDTPPAPTAKSDDTPTVVAYRYAADEANSTR